MTESTTSVETTRPRFNTLNEYEVWVADNWVHELGSDEAQLHVRSKLDEEVAELNDALEFGEPDAIKAELGDLLWTSTAVAINEGFTIGGEPLELDEIDKRAKTADIEWDVPVLRGLYGYSSDEITQKVSAGDLKMTQLVMKSLAGQLGKAGRMTHKFGDQIDFSNGKHNTFGSALVEIQHHKLVNAQAQILLLSSLIAQSKLGLPLSKVMQANYDKLSGKVISESVSPDAITS